MVRMSKVTLTIGDRVQKLHGYKWPGEVRSIFTNRHGEIRIVVECTVPEVSGALHIYNINQVVRME